MHRAHDREHFSSEVASARNSGPDDRPSSDWEQAVEPVLLRRKIDDGRHIRSLYLLGPEA
jgi:hypothetical protein